MLNFLSPPKHLQLTPAQPVAFNNISWLTSCILGLELVAAYPVQVGVLFLSAHDKERLAPPK